MMIENNARRSVPQDLNKHALTGLDWLAPQILAVEFEQIERETIVMTRLASGARHRVGALAFTRRPNHARQLFRTGLIEALDY